MMRCSWTRSIAVALLLSVFALGCETPTDLPPPPMMSGPGTISGQLLTAQPGTNQLTPAAGALAKLVGTTVEATTDSDGRFVLQPVLKSTGALLLQADPDAMGNYQRQQLIDLTSIGAGPGHDVSLGQVELNPNATIVGTAVVSGETDSTTGQGGTTVFVPEGPFTTYTGDNGSFVFDNLPAGQITLAFFRMGFQPQTISGITLNPGQLLQLQQVVLQPMPAGPAIQTGSISGQVVFVPSVQNAAEASAEADGQTKVPFTIDATGTYDTMLDAGLYTLKFSYPGYSPVSLPNVLVTPGVTTSVPLVVMTPSPAGTDAGTPDSGPPDAGIPDAGVDAGMPPPDAGPAVDAGPLEEPPIARIVTTSVVAVGGTLVLDGTSSQATGEEPGLFLSYAWTQTSGTSVINTFTANDSVVAGRPSFTAPSTPGSLSFTLTVTDTRTGFTADTSVTVQVVTPPVAAISPTLLQVAAGDIATFDGSSSSDPSGFTLSYAWSGAGLELGAANGSAVSFRAPMAPGRYTVQLVVSDLFVSSTPATAELEVVATDGGMSGQDAGADAGPSMAPPIARIVTTGAVGAGGMFTLDGTGSEAPDTTAGLYLSYAWTQTSGTGVLASFTVNNSVLGGKPTLTAPSTPGPLGFTLTVTDTRTGLTGQASTVVQVIAPPTAVISPVSIEASPGATVTFDGSRSTDPSDYALSYNWTSSTLALGSATGSFVTFTAPSTPGTYSLSLVVSDLFASSLPATAQLQVVPTDGGTPPDAGTVVDAGTVQQPPIARIETTGVVAAGRTLVMDATSSQAAGELAGLFLSYAWAQTSGTSVINTFTANDSVIAGRPSFTAPALPGQLVFTLTVTDTRTGLTGSASVTVQVIEPPTAVISPPVLQVAPGEIATFDGSGSSDPNGFSLTYAWSGAGLILGATNGKSVTFAAPTTPGAYSVQLVVSDLFASSADTTAELDVVATDGGFAGQDAGVDAGTSLTPPIARILTTGAVGAGQMLTLDGTGSQAPDAPAGLYLSFAWTQTSGTDVLGSFSQNDSVIAGKPTFTAPSVAGPLGFTLTVTDTRTGLTGQATTIVEVLAPPTAVISPTVLQATPGETVTFDGSQSSDPSGYAVSYNWTSSSLALGSTSGTSVTFTAPSTQGTYSLSLIVSDLFASSAAVAAQLEVIDTDGGTLLDAGTAPADAGTLGTPPTARIVTTGVAAVGGTLTLDGTQSQAPGASPGLYLSYAWTQTAGDSVLGTFTENDSVLAGRPLFTAPASPQTLGFTLTVTDTRTGLSAQTSTTVQVVDPPVAVVSPTTLQAYPGTMVTFDGSASTDPSGNALTYQWSSPALSLGTTTGSSVSFTAPMGLGTYGLQLVVSNPFMSSAPVQASLQVVSSGTAPSVDAGANQIVAAGTTVQLTATGVSPDPITWSWTQTAGTRVTLANATTATPTFTAPFVAGVLTFQVTATTTHGTASATTNVDIQIVAPLVSTPANLTVSPGATVSLVATGSSPNPITYSWVQTSGTPTVTLSGANTATATFTAPSSYAYLVFQVTAVTSAGSATATTNVTVKDTTPPAIIQSDPSSDGTTAGPWLMATATFDKPLDPTSVTTATAYLTDASGNTLAGTVEYISATQTIRVVPDVPLTPGANYALNILGVQDLDPTPNVHPAQALHFTARPGTWTTWNATDTQSQDPAPGVIANDTSVFVVENGGGISSCSSAYGSYYTTLLAPQTNGTLAQFHGVCGSANYTNEPVKRGFRSGNQLYVTGDVPHYGNNGYYWSIQSTGVVGEAGIESNGPPGVFFSDSANVLMLTSNGSAQFAFYEWPPFSSGWVDATAVESAPNYSSGGQFAGAGNGIELFLLGLHSGSNELFGFQRTGPTSFGLLAGAQTDKSIATINPTNPWTGLPRGVWAANEPVFVWSTSAAPDELDGVLFNSSTSSWQRFSKLNNTGPAANFDIESRYGVVLYAYVDESSGLLYLRYLNLGNMALTNIPGPAGAVALNANPACGAIHPEISSTDGAIYITWGESCTSGSYTVYLRELQ